MEDFNLQLPSLVDFHNLMKGSNQASDLVRETAAVMQEFTSSGFRHIFYIIEVLGDLS
jgi:hypothetical protein